MDESFVEHLTARPKAATMIQSAKDTAHLYLAPEPEHRSSGMGRGGISGLFARQIKAYERRQAGQRATDGEG